MPPLNPPKRSRLLWFVGFYVLFACVVMALTYHTAYATDRPPIPRHHAPGGVVNQQQKVDTPTTAALAEKDLAEQTKTLAADTAELARQKEFLEDRAKDVDKRADDLSHLISTLTVVSGFYTVLVGVFAYFSLENAKKNAETQLTQYKEQFNDSLTRYKAEFEEAKSDIPNLYGMQQALRELLFRLRRQVATSKIWTTREAYDAMTEIRRQEVLLAEMTMTSFDYFRPDSSPAQNRMVAKIFADLCGFYASRSKTTVPFTESDFTRASLYINRACEIDKQNASHFAARAALTLAGLKRPNDKITQEQLDRAEADLTICLDLDGNEPVGLYNAAWIDDERGNRKLAADRLANIIERREKLPEDFRGSRLIKTLINHACAQSHLLQNPPLGAFDKDRALHSILADCRMAKEEAVLYREEKICVESLKREWSAGGELFPLAGQLDKNDLLEMQKLYETRPGV